MSTSQHYFSADPQSSSQPVEVEVQVRGLHVRLHSDRGVFSKTHADTGTLLLARHAQLPPRGDILDLGCGYGLLGIVAALASPQASVTLVDINPRAAELARLNCRRHGVKNAEVLIGDAPTVLGDRTFDAVLCNPPYRAGKATVMALLADAARRLNPGGAVWFVGRTKQGIKTLARDVSPEFDQVETVKVKGGYRVMVGRRAEADPTAGDHT